MCIALANYLHSRFFARTRYLEVNPTHEIALLNIRSKSDSDFRMQGVHYYPNLTIRTLNDVLSKPCTYSVLDFGVLTPGTYREFLACDLRIVMHRFGSLILWIVLSNNYQILILKKQR